MLQPLNWSLGLSTGVTQSPDSFFPAHVPGAAQHDYANSQGWPPFWYGLNYRDYAPLEDVYWHYRATLQFSLTDGQMAELVFGGLDYRYLIRVDGDELARGEGMFTPVRCDVSAYAGRPVMVEVILFPCPKADDSNSRDQARKSCKPAACYGWDWHPRLLSAGIWDDAGLLIRDRRSIRKLDVAYQLSDGLDQADVTVGYALNAHAALRLTLLDGQSVVAQARHSADASGTLTLHVSSPKLWYPVGYGQQHRYQLQAEVLDKQGRVTDVQTRSIGFRRVKLLMHPNAWKEPSKFPMSRSAAPTMLEVNGIRVFAKGSNWVNAQVFPGEMTAEHYRQLLELVRDANMNMLRIWGGGFVNKESFFELCDELGIMVWQEFPLACNEYPDEAPYLAVLEQEANSIVRRLRTHPCLTLWCGGNELFNSWSGMTDQHHALRLLNAVCYREDPFTPFLATSPLVGMGHGPYYNYDEASGHEFITDLIESSCTAYTEFGSPSASDADYIHSFMSEEDYADCNPQNEVWTDHHAFNAWIPNSWLRTSEANYYFGGWDSVDDLIVKTQFLQGMCYRAFFEEMRKQPLCSMALNWCLNEPWPTAANNNLISWPAKPKAAYYEVKAALRPQAASLRVRKHLWRGGERFSAEVWLLNDALTSLENLNVTVSWRLDDTAESSCGTFPCASLPGQQNVCLGGMCFELPKGYTGKIHVSLKVSGHEEMDATYVYLCRAADGSPAKKMLNM